MGIAFLTFMGVKFLLDMTFIGVLFYFSKK